MVYELSHFIQKKIPFVWEVVEWGNTVLFHLLYGWRLPEIHEVLRRYSTICEVDATCVSELANFFKKQPEEAFRFFKPHAFDVKTLRKLQRRKSFLMYCVRDSDGKIVGYFFLRCFFIGKAFLGKMVGVDSQGKGIGKKMCLCAMEIAEALGLRMFETISKDNVASLRSTEKVLNVRIIEEMGNGYLYIEDLGRKTE